MMNLLFLRLFLLLSLTSCNTGNLIPLASIDSTIKESSAAEVIDGSNLIWTLEDSGNDSKLYAFDVSSGHLERTVSLNIPNKDWEDLASDAAGNLYIGDIGNNSGKRDEFQIYKIENPLEASKNWRLSAIRFTLPKKYRHHNFEGFFEFEGHFFLFSKNKKEGVIMEVPNKEGMYEAKFLGSFNLKGKDTRVTAADISSDGKEVVLLNHDKMFILKEFKGNDFFSGTIEEIGFQHDSQKEGLCFLGKSSFVITDEYSGKEGGNIYLFQLDKSDANDDTK